MWIIVTVDITLLAVIIVRIHVNHSSVPDGPGGPGLHGAPGLPGAPSAPFSPLGPGFPGSPVCVLVKLKVVRMNFFTTL